METTYSNKRTRPEYEEAVARLQFDDESPNTIDEPHLTIEYDPSMERLAESWLQEDIHDSTNLLASPDTDESTAFNSVTTNVGNLVQNDTAYRQNLKKARREQHWQRLFEQWQDVLPSERNEYDFQEVPFQEAIAKKRFLGIKARAKNRPEKLDDVFEFYTGDPRDPGIISEKRGTLIDNPLRYVDLYKTHYIINKQRTIYNDWLLLQQNRRRGDLATVMPEFMQAHPHIFNLNNN